MSSPPSDHGERRLASHKRSANAAISRLAPAATAPARTAEPRLADLRVATAVTDSDDSLLPGMNRAALRYLWAFAWPIALIVFLYERTAWLGFNVLDEGLIASYSQRLLDGEVPHLDFISPRPIGSSILHLPDLLLPMPQYIGGRLIGITTVVAYSVLIAWLIYGRPPSQWGVVRAAGAAASALVNLHTFLETPWYTFDGLLLSAAAILMLERALARNSVRLGAGAFLAAGLAVTTKQSFAPVPIAL